MQVYPLQVPTDKDRIYDQFLTIVNFLIYEVKDTQTVSSPLTNKELMVLGAIMFYNDKYRNLPQPERAEYIMGTDIRRKIRDRLELKANHLNNVIARLKQKYYLGEPVLQNSTLSASLDVYLDSDLSIEFKLNYEIVTQKPASTDREPVQEILDTEGQDSEPPKFDREVYDEEAWGDTEG